jgi:hypothetical protein
MKVTINLEWNRTFSPYSNLCTFSAEWLSDKITIFCDKCNQEYLLFDSSKNGYEGELGLVDPEVSEEMSELVCDKCSNSKFKIAFGFEHTVGIEEADELIRDEKLKVEIEDLFTWLFGNCECTKCQAIMKVIDIECA